MDGDGLADRDLRIVARDGAITAIEFSPFRAPAAGEPLGFREDDDPLLRRAVDQLDGVLRGATSRSSTSRWPRAAAPSSSGCGTSCG